MREKSSDETIEKRIEKRETNDSFIIGRSVQTRRAGGTTPRMVAKLICSSSTIEKIIDLEKELKARKRLLKGCLERQNDSAFPTNIAHLWEDAEAKFMS